MKIWLLVTTNVLDWYNLEEKDPFVIAINSDEPKFGDIVLIYKTSPHRKIEYIYKIHNSQFGKLILRNEDRIHLLNPPTFHDLSMKNAFKDWHKTLKKGIITIPHANWTIIKQHILNGNRSQSIEIKNLINDLNDKSVHINYSYEQTILDEIKNYYKKGLNLFDSGDYKEAIKYFDKVVLHDPNCTKVHYCKGKLFETIGSYYSALDCYNKVLSIDATCMNAIHHKGVCLRIMGKIDESNECFDKILKENPNNLPVLIDKGFNLLNQKKYYLSIEIFEIVLKSNLKT